MSEKPKSFEELRQLRDAGDIEILASIDKEDGTTILLIQDNRRNYGDGEIYEIRV